jgi:hypothetical protein
MAHELFYISVTRLVPKSRLLKQEHKSTALEVDGWREHSHERLEWPWKGRSDVRTWNR